MVCMLMAVFVCVRLFVHTHIYLCNVIECAAVQTSLPPLKHPLAFCVMLSFICLLFHFLFHSLPLSLSFYPPSLCNAADTQEALILAQCPPSSPLSVSARDEGEVETDPASCP